LVTAARPIESAGAAEQVVELTRPVECVEVVETADVTVADEDLRHRATTAAPREHRLALRGLIVDLDLAVGN
jgi:hypothetical protein